MPGNLVYILLPIIIVHLIPTQANGENVEKGEKSDDSPSIPSSSTPSSYLLSSVLPDSLLEPSSDIYSEEWDDRERVYDIDELEAILGGPLKNRRFVSVSKTRSVSGGKHREVTYKFRTNARRKRDGIREMSKDKRTHPKVLNNTLIEELQKNPEGYESNTIYYHFSHQLTALEQMHETNATIGSPCQAKNILDHDYCERAVYPNKNKMVCNKVMLKNSSAVKIKIQPNTCTCKFYRMKDSSTWKQMTIGKLMLSNGQQVDICRVPVFGVCDHRTPVGIKDVYNNHIYELDTCKGHFQCDNSKLFGSLVGKDKMLRVQNHCTDEEFLHLFKKNVRSKVLLCAKPHPRRFSAYDEYKYYCLPENSRDPEQWRFKRAPSEEPEEDKDFFFS